MDLSLLIGILLGLAAILFGFTIEGGSIFALLLLGPAVIVIGGTLGVTIASFSIKDIGSAVKFVFYSFTKRSKGDPDAVIEKISNIAEICRREGLVKIEQQLKDPDFKKDEFLFLKEGLILAMEGRQTEEIRHILKSDIRAYTLQKETEINVFESAGRSSAIMGVLGTVISLIITLADKSRAQSLAASAAAAFVAAVYGLGLANIVYLPIAAKLRSILKRQKIQKEMIMDGVCMLVKAEASRNILNHLSLYYQAFPGGKTKYREGINN
jgi:chemotaxis protein MotA